MIRYALFTGSTRTQVEPYLPSNYRVLYSAVAEVLAGNGYVPIEQTVVVAGEDYAGWTLDDYVLPRLASGMHYGKEIDLSHPIMKRVPA